MGEKCIVCYVCEFSEFDNALLVDICLITKYIYMIPINIDNVKKLKDGNSIGIWKIKEFKTSHL